MKVYQAINAVQGALAKKGVGKNNTNTFDNYKFRGIDDVYNALSPLLAEHGLCILPRMLSRSVEERTSQKGGALFYVTVDAEFDFVCAEDFSKHTIKVYGEAMDRGDKATNKAMAAAYKYAAFLAFAIPTEGEGKDTEEETHEVKAKMPTGPINPNTGVWESLTKVQQNRLTDMATIVMEHMDDGDVDAACDYLKDQEDGMDAEEVIGLWSRLGSKPRSAIKKRQHERKREKQIESLTSKPSLAEQA